MYLPKKPEKGGIPAIEKIIVAIIKHIIYLLLLK